MTPLAGGSAGEIVRAAYDLHKEDDDFGQAGALYRNVLSETDREHLVGNIAGTYTTA